MIYLTYPGARPWKPVRMKRIERIQRIGTTHPARILSMPPILYAPFPPFLVPILSILFPVASGMLAPLLGPATDGEGALP